jgi:putative tricarboxylic transport membrane protein
MFLKTSKLIGSTLVALTIASTAAYAQLDLKITAPAGVGGGWDAAARTTAQTLKDIGEGGVIQVQNVPGAGGTIGLAQFASGSKDSGNELLVGGITLVGAILTNKSPVDLSQVKPLARLTGDPLVIVVPANSPIKSVADLAAKVKGDVAGVSWAGGSAGGADHILAALFTKAAGGDPSKVNYIAFSGGGEALAAMLGAKVTAGVSGYGEFESQIKSGALRALAVSSPERLAGVDVPTLKELGVDVEVVNWRGIFAKPNVSSADEAKLSAAIKKMVKSPQWAKILKDKGWSDYYAPAPEFASFLKVENERVGAILKSIGLVN